MIDVLEWSAAVPASRYDDARDVLRGAHSDAVNALRSTQVQIASRQLAARLFSIAAFVLGLGLGVSYNGGTQ